MTEQIMTRPTFFQGLLTSDKALNDNVIAILNRLIVACRDSYQGYQLAMKYVSYPKMQDMFDTFAEQRMAHAAELTNTVIDLGGKPWKSGSFEGTLHRGLLSLRSRLDPHSEHAILEEIERNEDMVKEAYEAAMEQHLPLKVHSMIRIQYDGIVKAHNHIRLLRDMLAK